MNQSQQENLSDQSANHCYWHPEAETGLSCSQCGKSICINCMVQAPVGIRCRECGKSIKIPTYDIQRSYYARAVGVGIAIAIVGGFLWGVIALYFAGIIGSVAGVGLGYAAGELVSRSVNLKRGTGLAWIAGGSVVMALLVAMQIAGPFFGWYGLLFIGWGVYSAVKRVR